jgi:hypothetical protein
MSGEAEVKIRQDLSAEIALLESSYRQVISGLSARDYDASVVASALKTFKDSLSRASAFTLTLYTLRGKQINISWDHLFTHIDYALSAVNSSPSLKQRDTVQTILSMSKPELEQILTFFATLKKSIK